VHLDIGNYMVLTFSCYFERHLIAKDTPWSWNKTGCPRVVRDALL
jgi:hypothetical protein